MTSSRKLRPNTIVPAELYVERSADRQLNAIVDEMGRPGYVLVARQMGKTNLLLSMKRRRPQDVVLYLDLSTRFDTATAWFRNVIDRLVEAYPDEFANVFEDINNGRKIQQLDASVEYDRHLRRLLKSTKKNVVIILDEIDALVNTKYSDVILSQIRSMYFQRDSYEEYNRLTYVLSGVAEPTDLIKDKSISPFNIGEKIYLENFDKAELEVFLKKAELDLEKNLVEHLYSWTAGNPRMTWDVCAELERISNSGFELSVEIIDHVIDRLYLKEFDRAPIDHIRTLVESDPVIRAAIVEMRFGKAHEIDAKVRNRLYLAGIASSTGSPIKISNRIIDQALDDAWIAKIDERSNDDSLAIAVNYSKGSYSAVIDGIEKIHESQPGQKMSAINRRLLALSYLNIGSSEKAIQHFMILSERSALPEHIQEANFFMAVAYQLQKNWKEALAYFERAQSGPDKNFSQRAHLEIIHVLIDMGTSASLERALSISSSFIDELEVAYVDAPESPVVKARLTSALYYEARVLMLLKNRLAAALRIQRAIKVAESEVPPIVSLFNYDLIEEDSKRSEAANAAATAIIEKKFKVDSVGDLTTCVTRDDLGKILLLLYRHCNWNTFNELLIYYSVCKEHASKNFFSLLLEIAEQGEEETFNIYYPLLIRALDEHSSEATAMQLMEAYRIVAVNCAEANKVQYIDGYLRAIELADEAEELTFNFSDVAACFYIYAYYKRNRNLANYQRLLEVWQRFKVKPAAVDGTWVVYIRHFEMNLFEECGMFDEARAIAEEIVALTDEDKLTADYRGIDIGMAADARRYALALLAKRLITNVPLRSRLSDPYRNIKRNQMVVVSYRNLEPVQKKFKNVEADLRMDLCKLVKVLPV